MLYKAVHKVYIHVAMHVRDLLQDQTDGINSSIMQKANKSRQKNASNGERREGGEGREDHDQYLPARCSEQLARDAK